MQPKFNKFQVGKQGIVFVIWKGQENAVVHHVPVNISTPHRRRRVWNNFELQCAWLSVLSRCHTHLFFRCDEPYAPVCHGTKSFQCPRSCRVRSLRSMVLTSGSMPAGFTK